MLSKSTIVSKVRVFCCIYIMMALFMQGRAFAAEVATPFTTTGGIKVFDATHPYWVKFGGRIQFDDTAFTGDYRSKGNNYASGANLRRVFWELSGGLGKHIDYQLTLNFRKGGITDFDYLWLRYTTDNKMKFMLGFIKPLDALEYWAATTNFFFLEPSLSAFAFGMTPDRALGVLWTMPIADTFTFAASVFQPRHGPANFGDTTRSDKLGESMRITFVPEHMPGCVYHLGVFGRRQAFCHITKGGVQVLQNNLFATFPEAIGRNTTNTATLVNTSNIRARSYTDAALEAAIIQGPVTLMAEYHAVNVQRVPRVGQNDIGNLRFNGWLIQGGYVLTGEFREYDFEGAAIGTVKPKHCGGAVEVTARFSGINLIDKNIYGGSEKNVSLGVNWFVNNNVEISGNYIRANINPTNVVTPGTPPLTPVKRMLDIFAIRFQVIW